MTTGATVEPMVAIVEDDAAIAEGLVLNLRLQGYRSRAFADGETGHAWIAENRPDLVLLDISLPRHSGLWVLERLRHDHDQVPVIVLSARQDESDKVSALRLGADDYVTKPFALAELLARVGAVLRRARATMAAPAAPGEAKAERAADLRVGDITIDMNGRNVTHEGRPLSLTHLEFELLAFFCLNANRVHSREELVRKVWGLQHCRQVRTVDNFVAQLRTKLGDDPDRPRHLQTVRGSGYRFVPG
jgi:DNA-binding response OmpR family regulator